MSNQNIARAELAGEIEDQLLSRPDSEGAPVFEAKNTREPYSPTHIQVLGRTATGGPRKLPRSSRTLDANWWNTPLGDGTPRWQAAVV